MLADCLSSLRELAPAVVGVSSKHSIEILFFISQTAAQPLLKFIL